MKVHVESSDLIRGSC